MQILEVGWLLRPRNRHGFLLLAAQCVIFLHFAFRVQCRLSHENMFVLSIFGTIHPMHVALKTLEEPQLSYKTHLILMSICPISNSLEETIKFATAIDCCDTKCRDNGKHQMLDVSSFSALIHTFYQFIGPWEMSIKFETSPFKLISVFDGWVISCEIAPRWMPPDGTVDK